MKRPSLIPIEKKLISTILAGTGFIADFHLHYNEMHNLLYVKNLISQGVTTIIQIPKFKHNFMIITQ